MAKEQRIVARDFLGLSHTTKAAEQEEEMSKQAALANLRPSLSLFQDVQSKPVSHSKGLGNPSGQGMRLDFCNQNGKRLVNSDVNNSGRQLNSNTVNMASHGNKHVGLAGGSGDNHSGIQKPWLKVSTSLPAKDETVEDGSKLNEGEKGTVLGNYSIDANYRHYAQERGMWHPWNKSALMQQATNFQVLPGNIAPADFHSAQAVDGPNMSQTFGLQRVDGNITSNNNDPSIRNEAEGKSIHARHLSGMITESGFRPIGPVAVKSSGKSVNPQLTIFYGGAVNVFDDVPVEKAQAIMLLAGNGFPSSMKVGDPASTPCMLPSTSPVWPSSPSSNPIASSHSSRTQSPQKHSSMQVGQVCANPLTATAPSHTCHSYSPSASKQEPFLPGTQSKPSTVTVCPPTTLKALPQARKASLARFLEKRKERVCSKIPYSMKKGPQDTMLFQGDKLPAVPGIDETARGMEERVALLEDVATSEMEAEEHVWFKKVEMEKHASETDCCSISLVC